VYGQQNGFTAAAKGPFQPTFEDYQKVYKEIAERLEEKDDYDDGSYGPVLVRLAWHASGTYDVETKTGGSNGATMRFSPEGDHGANAGLKAARDFLEPVKGMFFVPLYPLPFLTLYNTPTNGLDLEAYLEQC
jgi:cytochrome c peroxidase